MKRVKYEIGYDLFSLIPASVTLLVFGGTTVILKIKNNGMFIFTGLLSLAVIAIIAAVLYAHFFKKILIDDEGFYYKNGIGKAKYYSEVTEKDWEIFAQDLDISYKLVKTELERQKQLLPKIVENLAKALDCEVGFKILKHIKRLTNNCKN